MEVFGHRLKKDLRAIQHWGLKSLTRHRLIEHAHGSWRVAIPARSMSRDRHKNGRLQSNYYKMIECIADGLKPIFIAWTDETFKLHMKYMKYEKWYSPNMLWSANKLVISLSRLKHVQKDIETCRRAKRWDKFQIYSHFNTKMCVGSTKLTNDPIPNKEKWLTKQPMRHFGKCRTLGVFAQESGIRDRTGGPP